MLRIMPYDQSQYCMNSMLTLKIQLLVEETEDNVMRRETKVVSISTHISCHFVFTTQHNIPILNTRRGTGVISLLANSYGTSKSSRFKA